jgi:hypothetical protein
MAYITQEMKKELAPAIKAVLKKYNLKGSIGIRHNSSLCVTISEGELDFIGAVNEKRKETSELLGMEYFPSDGYYQANPYRFGQNKGAILDCLTELSDAMKGSKWYNNSDIMSDYSDYAYYLDINIGKFDKPYVYNK